MSNNTDSNADKINYENQLDEILIHSLPLGRIKKICRLDPEVNMLTQEAVKMITTATERFVGELAKAAFTQAVIEKRKTIQPKDIDRVIKGNMLFEFLDGALDGWPDTQVKHRTTDTVLEEVETEEDEEPENDNQPVTEDIVKENAVTTEIEDTEPIVENEKSS